MPILGSEVSDEFEYIETPAAPSPIPPQDDYGVRTTTVCFCRHFICITETLRQRARGNPKIERS